MSDGFIIKRGGGGGDSNAAFKAYVDGSLTEVTADMLDGATSIRNYAFYYCSSLTSIEIPNGVTSIGEMAFKDCSSLASVTIPNSVTSIGNSSFYNCTSLTIIEIPNNVTSIGPAAFFGCSGLTNVTVKKILPPILGNNYVFNNTSQNLVIYVPAESVEAYKAASGWSTYADKIQAIPSEGD